MKNVFLALALLVSGFAGAQTTFTLPAASCSAVVTCSPTTIVLPVTSPPVTCVAPQTLVNGVCTSPVVVTPPPAAGTFWIYHAGQRGWECDVSYNSGTINYLNVDASAPGGVDITITGAKAFQPDICSQDFDTTGYNYLTYSIKPIGWVWDFITGVMQAHDTPIANCNPVDVGGAVDKTGKGLYGPVPMAAGQWNTYKIPLKDLCVTPGMHIYKFMIQRQTAAPAGVAVAWDVSEIGLVP